MKTAAKEIRWHALNVDLEPSAREAVEYALMEAGAMGTVTDDPRDGIVRIVGYFETVPDRELIRAELLEALRIYELPSSSVREINAEEVPQRDWLEEWKRNWQPVVVGRFVVAPPWSELNDVPDQIVIRIEPGMAFGTGTHETTRLCLEAIEKHFRGGSFLDVGTGTGILAIAAAKLHPESHLQACDIDQEAVSIAQENATANGVRDRIEFSVGTVDDSTPSADLVCANLTADVIVPLMETLLNLTCGKLILSGILETQLESVTHTLQQHGVSDFEVMQDGEWVCCVV
ncbi:MAG: 50S ribosomal protein L11 methyltransferase [Acidobacteria bacterium]|nr:MAG: 50S ribosomal protein L11 methyltransferase [Acidobacteriota bacterium]